jgi:hypothetical protein
MLWVEARSRGEHVSTSFDKRRALLEEWLEELWSHYEILEPDKGSVWSGRGS